MRNLLIRLAFWILRRCTAMPTAFPGCRAYVSAAKEIAAEWQAKAPENSSGEYRRHQVYAALIKRFPLARHRDLGMAIEVALGEME